MLDLWDCVHHIQNTIKDITNLLAFKPASARLLLLYFKPTDTLLVHETSQGDIEVLQQVQLWNVQTS